MFTQNCERKYMYIGVEPKAITADTWHLNLSSIQELVAMPMEENEITRAICSFTYMYLGMSVENRSQTVYIYMYDWIKTSH